MGGWITLNRSIKEHWIWNTSSQRFQRWVDLLFQAAWERKQVGFGNSIITLERGQIVTSIRRLMRQWGANNTTVSTTLQLFEQNGMIKVKRVKNMTIITIVNYDKYQKARRIEETLSRLEQEESDDAASIRELLNSALGSEDERLSVQNQIPIEQDNNINNQQEDLFLIAREENLRYAEELKNNPMLLEHAMRSLHCEKLQVIELIDTYLNDMVFIGKRHSDIRDFNSHFLNRAKIQMEKKKKNGYKKTKPGGDDSTEDKYAARRGSDVGNHTAKDYGGPFPV